MPRAAAAPVLLAALAVLAAASVAGAVKPERLVEMSLEELHELTFYELMDVDPALSDDDLGPVLMKAKRAAARRIHPDKVSPDKAQHAQKIFHMLVKAFDTLKDPFARSAYQIKLDGGVQPGELYQDEEEFYDEWDEAYAAFYGETLTEESAGWGLLVAGLGSIFFVVVPVLIGVQRRRTQAEKKRKAQISAIRQGSSSAKRLSEKQQQQQERKEKERRRAEEQQLQKRRQQQEQHALRQRKKATAKPKVPAEPRGAAPAAAAAAERREKEEKKAAAPKWSEAQDSQLVRLLAKYTDKTPGRWQIIAKHVNAALPRQAHFAVAAVQRRAESLGQSAPGKAAKAAAAPADTWTDSQQNQLERALQKYPPGAKSSKRDASGRDIPLDRWDLVSAAVDDKSKKQCVRRFKDVRARIQQTSK